MTKSNFLWPMVLSVPLFHKKIFNPVATKSICTILAEEETYAEHRFSSNSCAKSIVYGSRLFPWWTMNHALIYRSLAIWCIRLHCCLDTCRYRAMSTSVGFEFYAFITSRETVSSEGRKCSHCMITTQLGVAPVGCCVKFNGAIIWSWSQVEMTRYLEVSIALFNLLAW